MIKTLNFSKKVETSIAFCLHENPVFDDFLYVGKLLKILKQSYGCEKLRFIHDAKKLYSYSIVATWQSVAAFDLCINSHDLKNIFIYLVGNCKEIKIIK